jgi:sterol 3beta-glucosyltransferase
MRITFLALGSRGDVQPYIALGLALREDGHEVRLVAADFLASFVESWGLGCYPVDTLGLYGAGGEARAEIAATLDRAPPFYQTWAAFRSLVPVLRQAQETAWHSCQGTDLIVFSTIGTSGYHVAERLGVPCVWALTVPLFGRTHARPNPALPALPLGRGYNLLTHTVFEQFYRQLRGRISNTWRRTQLGLEPIPLRQWPFTDIHGRAIPTLYGYSPVVSPKPSDWGEQVHVTGYWFLDQPSGWRPPADLVRFLESGPPPVYVGFGSMVSHRSQETTSIVLDALKRSGQRGVIAVGWGALVGANVPEGVFPIESIPHSWLFPRMAAVVHHGGAGTTGAGLRAGVPSIVVPFAGDQPFWAGRVKELGVGPEPIPRRRLTGERLACAIRAAVTAEPMRSRAAELGETIRAEDGVGNAMEVITQVIGAGSTRSDRVIQNRLTNRSR